MSYLEYEDEFSSTEEKVILAGIFSLGMGIVIGISGMVIEWIIR